MKQQLRSSVSVLTALLGMAALMFAACTSPSGSDDGGPPPINEIYVSNEVASRITVYGRTASGNTAPLRTIIGAATNLGQPTGIFVDTVNNEIAVTNRTNNSITVYSRTADGDIAPLRTVAGAATGLSSPVHLVVVP